MSIPETSASEPGEPGRYIRQAGLRWMYLLTLTPALTDLVENGRLPRMPREWITEIIVGMVIAWLVHKVRLEHFAVFTQARHDELTGLWNRRAFEETLQDDCVRARRSGQPLSLVYIDLDNFKHLNDLAGHGTGARGSIGGSVSEVMNLPCCCRVARQRRPRWCWRGSGRDARCWTRSGQTVPWGSARASWNSKQRRRRKNSYIARTARCT